MYLSMELADEIAAKHKEKIKAQMRLDYLKSKYGEKTFNELIALAADAERTMLGINNGDIREVDYSVKMTECLEYAGLVAPPDIVFTNVLDAYTVTQASVIRNAKQKLRRLSNDSNYVYQGVVIDNLPETDEEIFEIGFWTVVNNLVSDTLGN